MTPSTIIIAIIAFGVLIIFHEFGHFVVAKAVGIKVEEFAIGMGPALYKFHRGETDYAIRILPIGGFVRMLGEDEQSDDERAFNNQSVLKRIAVIAAGPIMNFILTLLLLVIITFMVGIAVYLPVVDTVLPDTPAQQAGLQPGDRFISIEGKTVESADDARAIVLANPGKALDAVIERDGKRLELEITPEYNAETQTAQIGITFRGQMQKVSFFKAVGYSFVQVYNMTKMMIVGIGQLLIGQGFDQVMGPYGIVEIVGQAASQGVVDLLWLVAIISLNVGLINLVPFPALDGSRIVFLAIEGIRGKPIDREKEGMIHFAGLVILMLFMIAVTFHDIMR
ncbi:MAG: regulator of sigma protease [Clostridiales bacterium]|nr:regulator of sigma protease [Clostridiales bacterium]